MVAGVHAQETESDVVGHIDPVRQLEPQHAGVEVVSPLGVGDGQQHMTEPQHRERPRVAHRLSRHLESIPQHHAMLVGIKERDGFDQSPLHTVRGVDRVGPHSG